MFIRRAKTRTTPSGIHYYSYRLVDSHRSGDRVHQRTLLNLGNQFSVPQKQWKELIARIIEIIRGEADTLIFFSHEVEYNAQNIAALLLQKYTKNELLISPEKKLSIPQNNLMIMR